MKSWLAQGSSGRRVTLLPGTTFLHIKGALVYVFKTLPGCRAFGHSEKKRHFKKHASRPNSSTES